MQIERFFADVVGQNRQTLPDYFAPNAQVFWHCTNECFTAEEFIHINCDYPGSWKGTIERLELLADGYLLVGRVFDNDQSSSHHVVSLINIQAGKINRHD